MINLRFLEISELNSHHWEALEDALQKLESLLFLHLGVAAYEKIPFSILSRFTLQLQTLELYGAIDTSKDLTRERYTLPNLTRLVLKFSMVDQQFINKISELPSLRELVLSDSSYAGKELVFPGGGFASLTSLVIENMGRFDDSLTSWVMENEHAYISVWKIKPTSVPRIEQISISISHEMTIKLDVEDEEWPEDAMERLHTVFINTTGRITIEPPDCPISRGLSIKKNYTREAN